MRIRHLSMLLLASTVLHAQLSHSASRAARVNYFIGNNTRLWLRDVPASPKFRLPTHVAASANGAPALDYSTFLGGSASDHAATVATDPNGYIYVAGSTASQDFPVTSGAFQTASTGSNAFVAKFDSTGALVYCTYFGGNGYDQALAIAVDSYGNAYIGGETSSGNFPTNEGALEQSQGGTFLSGANVAFVTKLNAAGDAMLFSTLLPAIAVRGIAVDAAQDVFVTGTNANSNFTVTSGALSPIQFGAFVAKINPAGTRFLYATGLQYSGDTPNAMAIDSSGNAYVAGSTTSTVVRGASVFQPSNAGRNLFLTSDGGAHWNLPGVGLGGGIVDSIAFDGAGGVYAATGNGLFKSVDGGYSWISLLNGLVYTVAVDPSNPNHLLALQYQGTSGYVLETSRDGGRSWTSSNQPYYGTGSIVFDPKQPSNVYAGTYYSHDGGQTFTAGRLVGNANSYKGPYIDPFNPGTAYLPSQSGLYVTTNAGMTWISKNQSGFTAFAPDPAHANVFYSFSYGIGGRGLSKSMDGGNTWTPTGATLNPSYLAFDPTDNTTLYAITASGIFRSTDGAATFQPVPALPLNPAVNGLIFDPQHSGVQFAISNFGSDAFVTKISADGSTMLFSTYLGGSAVDTATGIALDTSGNIYVTGTTNSSDFNSAVNNYGGGGDAFVAKMSNDGTQLNFSRFVGGSSNETANGIAVDSNGNVYIAGSTGSADFPLTPKALESQFPATGTYDPTFGFYISPYMAYFTKMDTTGSILSSSFIGGNEGDTAYGAAVDPSGRLCIVGDTNSPEMVVTPGAAQPVRNGFTDAFLMILDFNQ